ncbi:MAG: response regulator [Isosphaeraceae bacterium]|nr:response regulator [Isosphaeraceae bacterium]
MTDNPLILVIDDSPTIRKLVDCHLSQAGYRVAAAPDAERGVEMARTLRPNLILLDHQLPGTTGDEVCRKLLDDERTARIPVVISSAMRNRAFARYTEFPNIVDQIPKPFTPELLKSGVANALQMGELVVQAQRTGSAMPESVGEVQETALEGNTAIFPLRSVLDFLNNGQQQGRLSLEIGKDRVRFFVSAGRVQAAVSATVAPAQLEPYLPADLEDLGPLLALTLSEQQDASMGGLIKLLERSLSDPRRLRALLRFQSSVLTYLALAGEPGMFAFETKVAMPPMFQAFPLQLSVAALAVEGSKRLEAPEDLDAWGRLILARQSTRGGNLDRTGLSSLELKVHTLLDGSLDLVSAAGRAGVALEEAAAVARGLELAGMVERRSPVISAPILVLDEDPETTLLAQRVLGPEGEGYQVKVVRDRVGAQLLLRRSTFDLVILPLDRPEHEAFYHAIRAQAPSSTRFVGLVGIHEEGELARLDAMGLDGVLHRPLAEVDLKTTVKHLLHIDELAAIS